MIEHKVKEYIQSNSFKDCEILNEIQKNVVLDRFINNLTYKQIGEKIKKTGERAKGIYLKSIKLISLYLNNKTPSLLIQDSLLNQRIKSSLYENDEIKCLKDFHNYEVYKLLRRNLGMTSILEIQKYIEDIGLSLKFPNEKSIYRLDNQFRKSLFESFTSKDLIHWIYKLSEMLREK